MSQNQLSNEIFNELMASAFDVKKKHPKLGIEAIATMVCTPYQDHEDHDTIVFQVTMNLVNAFR